MHFAQYQKVLALLNGLLTRGCDQYVGTMVTYPLDALVCCRRDKCLPDSNSNFVRAIGLMAFCERRLENVQPTLLKFMYHCLFKLSEVLKEKWVDPQPEFGKVEEAVLRAPC